MFLEFQNGIEITEIKSVFPFGDPLAKNNNHLSNIIDTVDG